jgi:hypothetical protein
MAPDEEVCLAPAADLVAGVFPAEAVVVLSDLDFPVVVAY